MRGELFEGNEIIEEIEEIEEIDEIENIEDDNVNNLISQDLKTLQKNYTILLEYVIELEKRNSLLKEKLRKMEMRYYEKENKGFV